MMRTRHVPAVVLVATVAVGMWVIGVGASVTSKHPPTRAFCGGTTTKKAVAAIKKTWDTLLNGTLTITASERFAVVDGSTDPTFRATLDDLVTANAATLRAATVRVRRVLCTSKTTAGVDYDLHVDGGGAGRLSRSGTAVLVGRNWKASMATVCDLFAPGDPSLVQRGPCAL